MSESMTALLPWVDPHRVMVRGKPERPATNQRFDPRNLGRRFLFTFSSCEASFMKSNKRYTTQTFKKRVDHEGGLHRTAHKLEEPAFCHKCNSVYSDGRWVTEGIAQENAKHKHWRPANPTTCPACKQIENGTVGGYVSISGNFLKEHRTEIHNLIENEAGRTLEDNPLSRVMNLREKVDRLIIETTTEHLAQRLGHSLKKAYAGEVSYDFSHENKGARENTHRD